MNSTQHMSSTPVRLGVALVLLACAGGAGAPPLTGSTALAAVGNAAPSTAAPGRWAWPLPGHPEVTRRFEPPPTPYSAGHRGADLAGAPGTTVLAPAAGVVAFAGPVAGLGVVSVRHAGGLRSTYEPVRPAVRVGVRVRAGQVLGWLVGGHPGCPRSACLHWGLLLGQTYLNPLSMLSLGPVRLLPLSLSRTDPDPDARPRSRTRAPA